MLVQHTDVPRDRRSDDRWSVSKVYPRTCSVVLKNDHSLIGEKKEVRNTDKRYVVLYWLPVNNLDDCFDRQSFRTLFTQSSL